MLLVKLTKPGNRTVMINPAAVAYLEEVSPTRTKIVFPGQDNSVDLDMPIGNVATAIQVVSRG